MNNIPDELILYIWQFIETNTEMIRCVILNKHMKHIGYLNGYIKHVHININADYMHLLKLYERPKSLISITFSDICWPLSWLPTSQLLQTMSFYNCHMGNALLIADGSRTSSLTIHSFSNELIDIDWSKFPNIQYINIVANNVNLEHIDNCKQLKKIRILTKKVVDFPDVIATLPNLISIVSNRFIRKPIHFESIYLKQCVVNMLHDCTSASTVVVKDHMKASYSASLNIRCF